MKRLLLLFFAIPLISCSSEETPSNKIAGTWAFHSVIEMTTTGDKEENPAGDCAGKSTIAFHSNGKFVESDYYYSYNSMECIFNEATFNREMKWEEVEEGKYRIFSDGSKGTVYEMRFPDKNTLWMIPPREAYKRDGVTIEYTAYVHKRI